MGRAKNEIKNEMTARFMADPTLSEKYAFGIGASFEKEFSLLSFENIVFEIIAFAMFLHELIFDNHKKEIDDKIYNQKSGRPQWYRYMALQFQYGFDLITDTDKYDNTNATPQQIEDSKIIKYSAVTETADASRMILKIAGEQANELAPIAPEQREAFDSYLKEFKFSGVKITVINYLHDRLFLNLRIYRDPLVLDENGMSILNGNFPVQDAIKEYMKELPFDGEFVIAHFVDKLQKVPGVKIPHVINVETSWIDPVVDDYGVPIPIEVKAIPVSGYFSVVDFNSIEYVV
jgi:hypothetical protein